MSDSAIIGLVLGGLGIFCFSLTVAVLGVLAICYGRWFTGKATKDGVHVAVNPQPSPASSAKKSSKPGGK